MESFSIEQLNIVNMNSENNRTKANSKNEI